MARRRRKVLQLSRDERHVAGTILLVLLLGPVAILIWPIVLRDDELWIVLIVGFCALLLSVLLVAQVRSAYSKYRAGVTLLAFSYGAGGFALVHVMYGAWVLATGLSPSKFNQVPVPRSYSMSYFLFAAVVGALAGIAVLVELHRRKRAT